MMRYTPPPPPPPPPYDLFFADIGGKWLWILLCIHLKQLLFRKHGWEGTKCKSMDITICTVIVKRDFSPWHVASARNCHFAVMRLRREKWKASRSCELVVARWFSSRVRTLASQAKPSPSPRVWLWKAFFVFFPLLSFSSLLYWSGSYSSLFPATAVFAVNLCSPCLRLLSRLCMFLVDRIQAMLVRSLVVLPVPASVTTSGVAWAQMARAVAVSLLLKHCLQ